MNTWNEIFSANLGKIMAIQIACAEHVVKNRDWNVDFDRGIISFGNDEYPLQFLGSEATSSNTWLWAWENINEFNDKIISLAREIKAKGEKLNLEALTTAEIDISDELNGHTLSIVACGLADKNYCYYYGPHSGGAILVAFDGVDEKVFTPVDAKDFADIVVRCIQQFPLNHKLFVESFLEWNKTKYKWKENTLIANFENSQKLEIDFEEKSELARIINIRLNS
ncbi:hypothetical protein KST12_07330 [Fusobacterium polymorphum]|uniref:Uncharacterized protein n=1 Tax=Fusobacterium nucleatum subsp. polymorphum TaxID=76857 RepID=A0A2C6BQE4_FUSNP|nr:MULTISPECIES: DUF6882 domain-containing protein [Fusobacterium]PHI06334.1 hypothetical protein CBG54_04510 [Fusobacterium polymorphum]PHI15618.1 hypothetical protein CBG58_00430 [Fusobacterium polymorphum]WDF23819.1 hypothetical protein PSC67_07135 [Fusobacterium nucleatum]